MLKTIDNIVRGIWTNVGVPDKYLTGVTIASEIFFFGVIFLALFQ